jgi:hypothetical protein
LFAPATGNRSCNLALTTVGFSGSYGNVQLPAQPPRFPLPDFIIASQHSKHSNRPVETITPLAAALGMPYNDKHANEDYPTVANNLLTHLKYAGKIVLVCWHHGKVPEFAQALGVSNPPDWPDNVFDRVWQITYSSGTVTLQNLPQMLLYGDAAT